MIDSRPVRFIFLLNRFGSGLYTEGSIKTLKAFTTSSHHLKDYLKPKSFIFDILNPKDTSDLQIYRDINQAVNAIYKYMKRIAQDLKLERVPTTNFARHSFSTILKREGVPIEIISEPLVHTKIKTTQIYLDSFESDQKQEITKFLTAFKKKT